MNEMEVKGLETENEGPDLFEQARIRREKLKDLIDEGKNPFVITKFERTSNSEEIIGNFEKFENETVRIAGRIMTMRTMGKAAFVDVWDHRGRIQIYVRIDEIGEESFKDFKKWDLGDIVGVEGFVFKTKKGEISIHVKKIELLSKSLLPLPDKWHGLKDVDMKYRQRYVDLMTNMETRDVFVKRSKIISAIRRFLDDEGYLEVETPILGTLAGGASARPFITHHNTLDVQMYMRIATELHLKRLIIGGFDKVYEIGRIFRNEGMDTSHNPEFTTIEFYQAYTNLEGIMDLIEGLLRNVCTAVLGTTIVKYGDNELDFGKPFERISMAEAVRRYANVDFDKITTRDEAVKVAKEHNIEVEKHMGVGKILQAFFDEYAEEKLVQPTFIVDYPIEISPFAKKKPGNPEMTERFELFVVGRELANAFTELNDPIDQRERFEKQIEMKRLGDDETGDVDEDFLTAMEYGMPPTGGIGMGIDRLVMLLTDRHSIRDVLLFPTMKPLEK